MSKVIVIGGGAAGMIAAISAAYMGHNVSIYEKNEKLGKKLFITGKGRCNITNAASMNIIMEQIVSNKEFLYSSFNNFSNEDIMKLIEEAGCKLKIERGNRVFPVSDRSSDVIKALSKILNDLNVEVNLHSEVSDIVIKDNICIGIKIKDKTIYADTTIVATGGLSYSATGSTGDGYKFAKKAGHKITRLLPSLVPLNTTEDVSHLAGLSLKNVELKIIKDKKVLYKDFGEMLFTHTGISGPLVLRASSICADIINNKKDVYTVIDLKPKIDEITLDKRLIREFEQNNNKSLRNTLKNLLPHALISIICNRSNIDEYVTTNNITKAIRYNILYNIKNLTFKIDSLAGFNQAVITKGGISVNEINPKNMESKLVKNLRFAGEVLDIDALTGGYNLQLAWSSGYTAGGNIDYV